MVTIGLIAVLLGATPRESIQIIGFSANEKLAAWRIDVAQPQPDGLVDFYGLIQVVDPKTGRTLATFRASKVRRTSIAGVQSTVSQRQLIADNPRYAAAQPQSAWRKTERRARFKERRVRMDYPSVRLIPDRGHELRGDATRERLEIRGAVRGPVVFTAVAHLNDGRNADIEHFAHRAPTSGRLVAFVRACISSSGRGLIVHTTFAVDDGGGLVLSSDHIAVQRLEQPLDLHPSTRHALRMNRRPKKKWEAFVAPWATADDLYDIYVNRYGHANNHEDDARNGMEPAYEVDLTAVVTSTDFPW
jgi:hypothetical protein